MKKSKHYRKDVVLARVIAGILLLILIVLLIVGISIMKKSSGDDKDSQNSQNTEHFQDVIPEDQDTEIFSSEEDQQVPSTEGLSSETEPEINTETTYVPDKVYVKTTTQVRLRKEPNTNCETLDRIDGGTKLEVLETLEGWYKVNYDGQDGYVSATYAKIVEE